MKKFFMYSFLCILAACFILPLVYSLYYSLLPAEYLGKLALPSKFTLDNYLTLFRKYPIIQWFRNTILNTTAIVVGNVIVCTMAGYSLSRLQYPGKNMLFIIIISSMMVPYQFIITPVYIMMAKLHWIDTMAAITVPFLSNSFLIFLARQFFITLPRDIEDAARIDGLNWKDIYLKIDMPVSNALIITIIIFSFTGTWNSYLIPATFLTTHNNFTLVVGLKTVKDVMFDKMNLTLAGVVLLSLPILIVFFVLQKYFIEGIATTGIKG